MKKIFLFIASAMVIFASCNKDPKKPNKPIDDEEGDELILIDGQFADWAAAEGVVTVKSDAEYEDETIDGEGGQRIDCLKTMKVVADKYNIYFYAEVSMAEGDKYQGGINWNGETVDPAWANWIDIYINADNKTETGGINWVYDPYCGWEYNYEFQFAIEDGSMVENGDILESEDGLFHFTGEDGTDIWASEPPTREGITGEGIFAGKAVKDGDLIKIEVSLTRSFMTLGNKVCVGMEVLTSNWMLNGLLPQANQGDPMIWNGKLLEITLP